MSKIKIITDSSVRLTKEEIEKFQIEIVHLRISIDGQNYIDGVNIEPNDFIIKMNNSKELPKTSQPPIGDFVDLYNKYSDNDTDVISIHMAASLSGTVNAAREAAKISKANVEVIDSDFTDRSMGFQVLKSAEMAQSGSSKEEIIKEITEIRKSTELYVFMNTLDNLVKGGRVSRMSGFISGLIRLKVVVQMRNQELVPVLKARSAKAIENFFDDLIEKMKSKKDLHSIGVSHAAFYDYSKNLTDKIKSALPKVPIVLMDTSPIIATHTGEKALAVTFY